MRRIASARLAGVGLGFAAIAILALALLASFELDREARLHRTVIGALQVKDSLEALRLALNDVRHAARIAALGGEADALALIDRRATDIARQLASIEAHPLREDRGTAFEALDSSSRLLVVNARSVRAGSRATPLSEIERLAGDALVEVERSLRVQDQRIRGGTLAQLQTGETLRALVSWLLAGSSLVLVGLFGFFRWARSREQAALARIEHLAHYDTVTGLPNRALLTDRLAQEIARAARAGSRFALLMFDLDGFKAVNDTWGHAAGDRLLAAVGERSKGSLRASDVVGRIGGDEFMAILPDTDEAGAIAAAEKLRQALERPYELDSVAQARVGASVGVALFPSHGGGSEALQRVADDALYVAKRDGRNQVRLGRPA